MQDKQSTLHYTLLDLAGLTMENLPPTETQTLL